MIPTITVSDRLRLNAPRYDQPSWQDRVALTISDDTTAVTLAGTVDTLAAFTNRLRAVVRAGHLAAAGPTSTPAVVFDPARFADWSHQPHPTGSTNADAVFGGNHKFDPRRDELTWLVEDTLRAGDLPADVWRTAPGVSQVRLWPTTSEDGPDGGGLVTVYLHGLPQAEFLPATALHHPHPARISTVDAVAGGLVKVAQVANRAVQRFRQTCDTPDVDKLYQVATDNELTVLDDLAARAGLLHRCPTCRAHNPPEATRCGHCGTPTDQPPAADPATPCDECGALIPNSHPDLVNNLHQDRCSLNRCT